MNEEKRKLRHHENKLSVATLTSDKSQKAQKILLCMGGYPEGITPKMIALRTGLNANTVKSILPRLKGVTKKLRGLYKVETGGDSTQIEVDLFDWNFHNLILTAPCVIRGVGSHVYDFGLVKVDASLNESARRYTFRLSCDFPLNVGSLCMVAGWVSEVAGCPFSDILVSTIEFNKDYKNLRLDGVKSIAVDNLIEQFKIYQKAKGLRVEHKTKVPMGVESILDMLSNNPNSVEFNVKLNKQREQLERLTSASKTTTELLYKVMEKLR